MRQLSFIEQLELIEQVRALRHENEALRAAVAHAYCGDLYANQVSCLLARGHIGQHCWTDHACEVMIRWG